jgi:hypothetical protein
MNQDKPEDPVVVEELLLVEQKAQVLETKVDIVHQKETVVEQEHPHQIHGQQLAEAVLAVQEHLEDLDQAVQV